MISSLYETLYIYIMVERNVFRFHSPSHYTATAITEDIIKEKNIVRGIPWMEGHDSILHSFNVKRRKKYKSDSIE